MFINRAEFLRRLALAGATMLTKPTLPNLSTTEYEGVLIYKFFVRGFRFHKGPEMLALMKQNDPLDLVLEPENEHDERAIAVYWNNEHVGYVPREDNRVFNTIIASGLPVYAYARNVLPDQMPWRQLRVGLCLVVPKGLRRVGESEVTVIGLRGGDGGWVGRVN